MWVPVGEWGGSDRGRWEVGVWGGVGERWEGERES